MLRTVFEQRGIEIAQLVADWLIRLPIRTCVKPPVTSDCSLAPKLLFVDWLKILANEKQAVQFRAPIVLVCEHIISSNIRLRHYTTGHHGLCQIKQRWNEASFPEQSVCKDLPRTNNAVEGWHRRFQANVGAYHPNFWKFIDILKREQSLNHVNISQARAGHQPDFG